MRNLRFYLAVALVLAAVVPAVSQQLWLSAGGRANITKKLRADIEVEHRSRDGFEATSRWSAGATVSYKLLPWLRGGVAYKFLYDRDGHKTTKKGNYIPAYWQEGHRAQVSLTGSLKLWKLELSLREAYQYTYAPGQSVAKYDSDGYQKDDEVIETENRHLLRSRIEAEYKHKKKSRLTPFVSVEVYNDLRDAFSARKIRYTGGVDLRLDKHNSLSAFYRFVERIHSDNDHVIGIGYLYKL